MLYEWRRLFAPRPGADTGGPQTAAEKDEEIRRLRAQLVQMQEREIVLKKSLGILSETPGSGMPRWQR
jgi:transposase-like protein